MTVLIDSNVWIEYLNGSERGKKAISFIEGKERVIDICLREKATHYINPIGGQELYSKEGQKIVKLDEEACKTLAPNAKIVKASLAKYSPKEHLFRHDPEKLAEALLNL